MIERLKHLPRNGSKGIPGPFSGESRVAWLKRLGLPRWRRGVRPSSDCMLIGANRRELVRVNPGDEVEGLTLFLLKKQDWLELLRAHRQGESVPKTCYVGGLPELIMLAGLRSVMATRRR